LFFLSKRAARLTICLLIAASISIYNPLARVKAFNERDILLVNLGVPAIRAALKAKQENKPMLKSVVQALFGGYIMYQGFKLAPDIENQPAWRAWQSKLMVNFGASLAESAGEKLVFRMDIGPVWLIADEDKVKFKPAFNAVVAPLIHLAEGAKLNWKDSFRYGTLAFRRNANFAGAINKSGALAYSNANTFITNENGNHAGHEMVHTLQYRRATMEWPNVSQIFPEIGSRFGDNWIDDTNWSIGWGLQCFWADINGESKDFDIRMEKEAYYLERKYLKKY
jgi:hypothetical protein